MSKGNILKKTIKNKHFWYDDEEGFDVFWPKKQSIKSAAVRVKSYWKRIRSRTW